MLDPQAFITARKARNLSQAELAAAAKVSQQLIASIEKGATRTTKFLPRIAAALDVAPGLLDSDWASVPVPDPAVQTGAAPGSTPAANLQDLPIHASAEGGAGHIIVTSDAVDWRPRPPLVAHVREAYGLYITGES